jgi:hypothetical protein
MKILSDKIYLVIGAVLITLSIIALSAPMGVLIRYVQDDAFYYLEIARNIFLGHGSTFDGICQTNGYHPLWMLILVPFGAILNYSREIGTRFAFLYGIALLGFSFFILNNLARRIFDKNACLVVLWVMAALAFSGIYGLETPLAVLMWSCVLLFSVKFEETKSFKDGILLGLFSGFVMLSRTDSFIYVAVCDAVWLYYIIRDNTSARKTMFFAWLCAVLIQSATAAAYFAYNYTHFGNIFTVSAAIKAGRYSAINLDWTRSLLAKIAVICAFISAFVLYTVRKSLNLITLKIILLGTLMYMAAIILKGNWESFNWYFALAVLNGGFAVTYIVNAYQSKFKYTAHLAVAVCGIILGMSLYGRVQPSCFQPSLDKAVWISRYTPVDSIIAYTDCGILGYISERKCVNLDGLTNSFAFQKAIDDNKLAESLKSSKVNLFVFPTDNSGQTSKTFELRITPNMHRVIRSIIVDVKRFESPDKTNAYTLWKVIDIRNK